MEPIVQQLMPILNEDENTIQNDVNLVRQSNPGITDDQIIQKAKEKSGQGGTTATPAVSEALPAGAPAVPEAPETPQDTIKNYLVNKNSQPVDNYSPEAKQDLMSRISSPSVGELVAQGVSGFGDAIARSYGGDSGANALSNTRAIQKAGKENQLAQFEAGRQDVKYQRDQESQTDMDDANSQTSKVYQEALATMLNKKPEEFAGMPASKIKELFPATEKIYQARMSKEAREAYGNSMSRSTITWELATPEQRKLAISMVKGNVLPGDLGMRDRAAIVTLANDYADRNNIPFRSYEGNVRKGMAQNLAYGKIGMNALSLNTALGHTADAMTAYDNLQNTDVAWLNKPINWLKENTNNPDVVALGLNLNALQGELANVFKNSGGTDQEIEKWSRYLNDDLTPSQAIAAGQKIEELLLSRLNALEYQQANVMEDGSPKRKLISPKGEKIMKDLKKGKGEVTEQSSAPQNEVKRKTKDGKVAVFDASTKKFLRYE